MERRSAPSLGIAPRPNRDLRPSTKNEWLNAASNMQQSSGGSLLPLMAVFEAHPTGRAPRGKVLLRMPVSTFVQKTRSGFFTPNFRPSLPTPSFIKQDILA